MVLMLRLLVILLVCCLYIVRARLDCCLSEYNAFGISCESGAYIDGTVYYCVSVSKSCTSCQLNSTEVHQSNECSKCCVSDETACEVSDDNVTNTSWALILLVFAGSCLCCSFIFLSAEENRLREGMTLQEAYLLPIPLVNAVTDHKDVVLPPDQPTAIGKLTSTIDVAIAEPTEYSPLITRAADH